MERISDILWDIPFIVLASLFQIHLAAKVGPIPSLLFVYILTGWIGTASLVRTQFYRFKNQEYILAARTLGAKDLRLMFRHIFPNAIGTIITSSVFSIPSVIMSESTFSYLGIINLNSRGSVSLGTMMAEGKEFLSEFPHILLIPASVIALMMIAFNLFGNGLRDAFNPSLRGADE
jgi:oligopeptide transport system permease protein